MRRILYFLRELGFDPVRTTNAVKGFLWFIRDFRQFKKNAPKVKIQIQPNFSDRSTASGSADGHYFWQDLICAKWIFQEHPNSHIDVGSRIDGFIAHLLTFMDVHQIDVRKNPIEIQGFTSVVADLTKDFIVSEKKYQSVSSLHSLEHFGLGRYGDEVSINGHVAGLINLASYVAQNGILYVSHPVGNDVIQFNSQRLLRANWATEILKDFELLEYVNIPWRGSPKFGYGLPNNDEFEAGSAILLKLRKT